jgi:thioesterase domain-containing protein
MTVLDEAPNLHPMRVTGARPPLFAVAAPGANALGYTALARKLGADQPFYVVQPRSRERTFPADGIGPDGRDEYLVVAVEYVASLRAAQHAGPYFLAGMWHGAHIAFQMARLLEAAGDRVALLATFDTPALEATGIHPRALLNALGQRLRTASPAERLALLRRKATGRDARAAGRRRRWPGESLVKAVIDAPIAVLEAREQPFMCLHDEALGWRAHTAGEVMVHVVEGGHDDILRKPFVEGTARALSACLRIAGA